MKYRIVQCCSVGGDMIVADNVDGDYADCIVEFLNQKYWDNKSIWFVSAEDK